MVSSRFPEDQYAPHVVLIIPCQWVSRKQLLLLEKNDETDIYHAQSLYIYLNIFSSRVWRQRIGVTGLYKEPILELITLLKVAGQGHVGADLDW